MITENQYFDSNVKSLGYQTEVGKSTIGVINPGEYEFGTTSKETMHIIEGELNVLLKDNQWKTVTRGGSFEVEANASFKVKTNQQTAYLCQYK